MRAEKKVLKFLFLLTPCCLMGIKSIAQIGLLRSAMSQIAKQEWNQSSQSLKKSIAKDTLNPIAKYVYAKWYFAPSNPRRNIDSAYLYLLQSIDNFAALETKKRKKIARFPLDTGVLVHFRKHIDSVAFQRTKAAHSNQSYNYFLKHFAFAQEREEAIRLRDELAFSNALDTNTYQSFKHYFTQYPHSHKVEEAKRRYEKLLFEHKTRESTLQNYIAFYQDHPYSPYRPEIEHNLFEMITASGEIPAFLSFIKKYPASKFVEKAKNIAYHIAKGNVENMPEEIMNDSLKRAFNLERERWFPFLENGKFGFMDRTGNTVLSPQYHDIATAYMCRSSTTDYLITPDGLASRSGKWIYEGPVVAVVDLGMGILQIQTPLCSHLVHKSGFELLLNCVEEAKLVFNRFVAFRIKGRWGLMALNGRTILDVDYQAIRQEEPCLVLTLNGKEQIYTIAQLIALANGEKIRLPPTFDEVEELGANLLLVRKDSLEGLLNGELGVVEPLGKQTFSMMSVGLVKEIDDTIIPIDIADALNGKKFDAIIPYLQWIGLYQDKNIALYHRPSQTLVEDRLDSLWFVGQSAMAIKKDSIHVFFNSEKQVSFPLSLAVTFVEGPETINYFYYKKGDKNHVFDIQTGDPLFFASFQSLTYLGHNTFHITHAGREGLVNRDGNTILRSEYESIIQLSNHVLSLLKDGKIGLYHLKKNTFIAPSYKRNLVPYNNSVWVAYKNGYYGLIESKGSSLSAFEFDEIKYWNDSSALVKQDKKWMLYAIYSRKKGYDNIENYVLLKDEPDEKIAIVQIAGYYGVLSNMRGIILPATLNTVQNIGTPAKPFYFAKKYIREINIYAGIYYDEQGSITKKQLYEPPEYNQLRSLFERCFRATDWPAGER